jgi:hypothetical protein
MGRPRSAIGFPYGSAVELDDDGAPRRWLDPEGLAIAEIGDAGVRLDLAGTLDHAVTVGGLESHLVLGPVQRIEDPARVLARVTATSWRDPAQIPAIDAPARLPAGVGTALLNVLALGARAAGRTLRYAGPYPTAALWTSLGEAFRPLGGADEASFTAGALDRAIRGDLGEVPVDFEPAPFERVQVAPRVVVHLRDGVERLYLGGLGWGPRGPRRLLRDNDVVRAALWIGGAAWAEVAVLGDDGRLVSGPRPLPVVRSSVLGKSFPPALITALAELLADGEPPLLAAAMREVLAGLPLVWGDPGADAARLLGGALVVHAGLWERLGDDAGALALGLAEALAGPVKQLAQHRLESVPIGTAVH